MNKTRQKLKKATAVTLSALMLGLTDLPGLQAMADGYHTAFNLTTLGALTINGTSAASGNVILNGTASSYPVYIGNTGTYNVTLNGVTITAPAGESAFVIPSGATVNLILKGNNKIKGGIGGAGVPSGTVAATGGTSLSGSLPNGAGAGIGGGGGVHSGTTIISNASVNVSIFGTITNGTQTVYPVT